VPDDLGVREAEVVVAGESRGDGLRLVARIAPDGAVERRHGGLVLRVA